MTTVYFSEGHEIWREFFALSDPKDELQGSMGFVKASISMLGINDKPVVHEAITDDPNANKTRVSGKLKQYGHQIFCELLKAEHLIPLSAAFRFANAQVRLRYAGAVCDSKMKDDVRKNNNPDFTQCLMIQSMLPNHSKNLLVELWNITEGAILSTEKDPEGYFGGDRTLIGTALIPVNTFLYTKNALPKWVNIYGPPMTGKGEKCRIMAQNGHVSGSAYRGRLLMRLSSRDEENPESKCFDMRLNFPEIRI